MSVGDSRGLKLWGGERGWSTRLPPGMRSARIAPPPREAREPRLAPWEGRESAGSGLGAVNVSSPPYIISIRSHSPHRFSTSRQTLTWIPDSFFSR